MAAKLTEEEREQIKYLRKVHKWPNGRIARIYGVSPPTISYITGGRLDQKAGIRQIEEELLCLMAEWVGSDLEQLTDQNFYFAEKMLRRIGRL